MYPFHFSISYLCSKLPDGRGTGVPPPPDFKAGGYGIGLPSDTDNTPLTHSGAISVYSGTAPAAVVSNAGRSSSNLDWRDRLRLSTPHHGQRLVSFRRRKIPASAEDQRLGDGRFKR